MLLHLLFLINKQLIFLAYHAQKIYRPDSLPVTQTTTPKHCRMW